MATQLGIYNGALFHLGHKAIATVTAHSDERLALDQRWDQVVAECLAEGFWNFAMRAVALAYDPGIAPGFGFNYAFQHPTDWVRTHVVSDEETFRFPLSDYRDEAGWWFANSTPLYVRYISNDPALGLDLSRWPASYTAWVEYELAKSCCARITGSTELLGGEHGIMKRGGRAKLKAKSTDAMDEGAQRPPMGTWGRSRLGGGRIQTPGGDRFDD